MEGSKKMISNLVREFAETKKDYYGQWTFSEPLLIPAEEDQKLRDLQMVLHKFIRGFVLNYNRWEHLMPLSEKSRRIIDAFGVKPYKTGSYRVDTVFDVNRQQKIIETTCRFALNGYFMAAVFDHYSKKYQEANCIGLPLVDHYTGFFPYLTKLIGSHNKLIVLRNADGRNASKFFLPIFEQMGFDLLVLSPEEINNRIDEITDGFLISELAIDELENLSAAALNQLVKMDMINDPRTVILVHDKRFYDVLGRSEIREAYLTQDEINHLENFYVPTYRYGTNPRKWNAARLSKNNWILKHRSLGKSQDVFSGILCSEDEWTALFARPDIDQFIIQRWVEQPRFCGVVNGVEVEDYVTGTLLYFNDQYFGPGVFRTSSCPVSNKTDDRKMFSITLREPVATTKLPDMLTQVVTLNKEDKRQPA